MKYQFLVLLCLTLVVNYAAGIKCDGTDCFGCFTECCHDGTRSYCCEGSEYDQQLVTKKNEADDRKVKLSLVYESLCPYCRNFITKQLGPNFQKFQNYLDIHLNPYGNAKTVGTDANDDYVFDCQHGVEECIGSITEGCLIQKMKNATEPKSPVPTISCIELKDDLYHMDVIMECMAKNDITSPSFQEVSDCATGSEGNHLFKSYGDDVAALDPPHQYVPWIMFNDHWDETLQNEAEANLPATLCKHFLHDVDECKHH